MYHFSNLAEFIANDLQLTTYSQTDLPDYFHLIYVTNLGYFNRSLNVTSWDNQLWVNSESINECIDFFQECQTRASQSSFEKTSLNWMFISLYTLASLDFFHTSSRTVRIATRIITGLGNLLVVVSFLLPKQCTVSTDPRSFSTDNGITRVRIPRTPLLVFSFSGRPISPRSHFLLYLACSKHCFSEMVSFLKSTISFFILPMSSLFS